MNTKRAIITNGMERAISLRIPSLFILFDDHDPHRALERIEDLISLQVWMEGGVNNWKPLLKQETISRSEADSGLLDFWIDASDSVPEKISGMSRIEKFERAIRFLNKLIDLDRCNDEPDRDRALQKLMVYAFQWFLASHQMTPQRWQKFLHVGSRRQKTCAKSVLELAETIQVRDAFWLIENLYEADAGFVDSEKHPEISQTKFLVTKHLWHVISHKDQRHFKDYLSRARLLKGPVLFTSSSDRKSLTKSDEGFRKVMQDDVYEACHRAVDAIVAAAKAFNSIDFECLLDQTKGIHGKWGQYLKYAGMKYDPPTFRITQVVFVVEGSNAHFGGSDIDVRIDQVNRDLVKAGEHLREMLQKAGVDLSTNGPILLRSSATFPCDFGTSEERSSKKDRSIEFEYILR